MIERNEYHHRTITHRRSCLADSDFAITCDFKKRRLEYLQRGDHVMSFDWQMKKPKCAKVVGVLRHPKDELTEFMRMQLSDNSSVTMTASHLIHIESKFPDRGLTMNMKFKYPK